MEKRPGSFDGESLAPIPLLPTLSATVAAHQDKSRSALGVLVCEQFGFFDARGREQRA